jgi:hypothetical protein
MEPGSFQNESNLCSPNTPEAIEILEQAIREKLGRYDAQRYSSMAMD